MFDRLADGRLIASGAVSTGGNGTGTGLGNQGGVVLTRNERWLLAINAGMPAAKAQSVRSRATWPQRRVGLATMHVDVAGRGSTPKVQDAEAEQINRIMAIVPSVAAGDERATRLVTASSD